MIRKTAIGFLFGSVAFVCAGSLAFGQSGVDEECVVQPHDSQASATEESLTETLSDCNGVLKPPDVGDSAISEPPPDVGETPVIEPDEIPTQPPESGG